MLLLISYDLDAPQRPNTYQQMHDAITAHTQDWLRPLYSQWLVVTNESVDTWAGWLQSLVQPQDRLLIVRVQGRTNGWLPDEMWAWINPRAV
jgi:hypothetical protein